ncbi:MAG: quinolinate synthase NadA [Flavobacteriaceae bacterium]|nr:quinolinate synthase NadA [Flavobacteriaceae bacterium]MCY4267131.1 quinolinate synthase NadA [Flavobacteriaceae bacterium]MCY4299913.1 quinolinate synthase NadA [Flavobacteriaceae bacterium]
MFVDTFLKAKENLEKIGYLDIEHSNEFDYENEFIKLKKSKDAVLLAHYYQNAQIQELADFLGDSLYLAQAAVKVKAKMIVFAGVHFMAETAKIINPSKKVLLPDLKAGCSLAESCPPKEFAEFKAQYPDAVVVSYINCTAEIKALSDIVCTSSNAKRVIHSIDRSKRIIFAPDKNLGHFLIKELNRPMILWDGACMVHEAFSFDKIVKMAQQYPRAKFIAHPESESPILDLAHYIGSTSGLLNYVQNDDASQYIVATEAGILHQMQKVCPQKEFIPAPVQDDTCACSECAYMKLNTMQKLYNCLKFELPEIILDQQLMKQAKVPIDRMLELG